jgi:hypothetical protein
MIAKKGRLHSQESEFFPTGEGPANLLVSASWLKVVSGSGRAGTTGSELREAKGRARELAFN